MYMVVLVIHITVMFFFTVLKKCVLLKHIQRWSYDSTIPSWLTVSVFPTNIDEDDSVSWLSPLLHTVFSNVKECICRFIWHSYTCIYTYKKKISKWITTLKIPQNSKCFLYLNVFTNNDTIDNSFRFVLNLNTVSLLKSVFEMFCTLPQYTPIKVASTFWVKNGCNSAIPRLSSSLFDLDFTEMFDKWLISNVNLSHLDITAFEIQM